MTTAPARDNLPPDPDKAQREASDPAASAWVNASAGSGKTRVLTHRVTRLLLAGVAPQKILCLTYTRAGAAEMANRVTGILSKWAVCGDDELRNDLDKLQDGPPAKKQLAEARRLFARVLSCPGGLRIRTIHSFCQEILSRFPLEAELPPHFALIEGRELDVLRDDVLDGLLREAGENPGGDLAQALDILVAAQGEYRFAETLNAIAAARARLAEAETRAGGREKLVADLRGFLRLGAADTPDGLRRAAMENIPEQDLRRILPLLAKGTPTYRDRGGVIAAILAIPRAGRAAAFGDYCRAFLTQENAPFKNFADKKLAAQHPEIDEICAPEAARLRDALERAEAAEIAQNTEAILCFGHAFAARLAARKAERAAVDYDDLILHTEALLRRGGLSPWILYKLDKGFDHILVDEAQDTSRAQWNIVRALTEEFHAGFGARGGGDRTLFVVGDEKQSIFSFQNADPEAFMTERDFFARRFRAAGKKFSQVPMHVSFRSAPAILAAVDLIFARDAARRGVSAEPVLHSPSAEGRKKTGRVETWPLLKAEKDEKDESGAWLLPTGYEDEGDPQAELAATIARKIADWLAHGEILPGNDRPIAPGDIMILLRRRGAFAALMVRALKGAGVPVTGIDRMKLLEQLPVMDLLATLRFALLPEDDLNLAALLRSPLLGLDEEQLMKLAIGRESSLWQSLKDKARQASAFAAAHDYLAARLNEADFSTPFAFLSRVLDTPCPANAVSGRRALWARLGHEALDPIEELLNEAQDFSLNHPPSLQNFLRWLTQGDAEIKRELDQGGGQVRIMTVHASKGLEAPIVFLPDTTALPRIDKLPRLQWSADEIPVFLSPTPRSGAAAYLRETAHEKQMEEYRRLFYVALTRAADRVYICGWLDKKTKEPPRESWYALAAAALPHCDYLPVDASGPAPQVVFGDPPLRAAAPQAAAKTEPPPRPLPAWVSQKIAAPAAVPPLLPIPEATAAATPDSAFARGRIIHRLLQSLPDVAAHDRAAAMTRFLSHPRHNLTESERGEIAHEVTRLLDDERFAALFAPGSLAEAPLTGAIDGVNVFRQVDRLCLRGDEVWIVDYKTNRPPPARADDIPAAYRQQLAEYRALLRGIYPEHKVRCFLLWTYAPALMEIES